jgi:hypothetical protein
MCMDSFNEFAGRVPISPLAHLRILLEMPRNFTGGILAGPPICRPHSMQARCITPTQLSFYWHSGQ